MRKVGEMSLVSLMKSSPQILTSVTNLKDEETEHLSDVVRELKDNHPQFISGEHVIENF